MSQITETVVFRYEEWLSIRGPSGELVSIRPLKGTWTLLSVEDRQRFAARGFKVKGIISCPRCGQATLLSDSFDPPKELGDGKPIHEFVCTGCRFGCRLVLKDWDRRKLYCVCYETKRGDSLEPHKEYLHAVNEAEARKFFWASHGQEVTHLVGVAPALGFFAVDKDAKRLVV